MVIGVDIDGVLVDLEAFQFECAAKYAFENNLKSIIDPKKQYNTDEFGWDEETTDRFWREYEKEYAINEPPKKFASEVLNRLRNDGDRIVIITARETRDAAENWMQDEVKEWCEKYKIHYDNIIFTKKSKLDVCKQYAVDIMIEDNVKNITTISKEIPVICMDTKYNQVCVGENIQRAYAWYDFYKIVRIFKEGNLKYGTYSI